VFVCELKVNPQPQQKIAINEAIRTSQFVRNKVLRYWMDNCGIGKTEMFRYNTLLRKKFKLVADFNFHACQTAVERVLRAVKRFYDNCKKQIPGKKGYPKLKKNTRSVEDKVVKRCRSLYQPGLIFVLIVVLLKIGKSMLQLTFCKKVSVRWGTPYLISLGSSILASLLEQSCGVTI
jgi:putative transposase